MFVLFGMGGVGKSRIALQYAMESRDKFEVILWITASNRAKITESFREVAKALGLALGSDDGVSVVSTMMTWLLGTSKHSSRFSFGAAPNTQAITGY
jgi:anion-transporting  ArsA/GET3 family ATPase